MPFQAILREVEPLRKVATRLETLADQNPSLSDLLTAVAESVCKTATLSEVQVAIRGPKNISRE